MKVLVLTDRFWPEIAAPSFRIMDHAKVWLKLGHEVTVVTCVPNFPHGRVFPGYRNRLCQEEWIEGVRVIRVWSYMTANEGLVKRTLDQVSYLCTCVLLSRRYPAFDVLLASSPPLFVALAGYLVAKLRRRPWVFEIRDLWPASIKAVGASDSKILRLFSWLERFLYRKADRIVSLTNSFREDLARRGISREKNDVVTNGVDMELFQRCSGHEVRQRLGVAPDDFLAGYIGTVGMAHGLETLLDAAELCRPQPRMKFLIMGEGAERKRLEELARQRGLQQVIFHDFVPHAEIPSHLSALDVSIIHLKPDPLFQTVIPSKLFESMATATPMVYAVEGESARIVSESGAGVCVRSGDAAAMAKALVELRADATTRQRMGAAGERAVRQHYSREAKARAVIASLEKVLGLDGPAEAAVPAGNDPFRPSTAKAT
jgi:glycosyltransferase involved in cell wall biosynthesis